MDNIAATNTSNNTVSPSSKAEGIVVCIVFALEALLIVAGNVLTIVLFALNKSLRKKSLLLVINMAVADLILGASFLPFYIYIYLGSMYSLWRPSVHFELRYKTVYVFFQGSLLFAAIISVERLYAIYWPLKHRTLSGRLYRVLILIAWTLGLVLSSIFFVLGVLTTQEIRIYSLLSYFLILLIIVCCCNILIWRKFQQRVITFQHQNGTLSALQNKRLTKTLLFVSVVALLSWLPAIIAIYFYTRTSVPPEVSVASRFLLYSNSFVNPIVYALRIPEFRQALRLCCLKRHLAMDMKESERRNNRAAALMPEIQLQTLSIDPVRNRLSANRTLSTSV